jgi:hypothetical protein
MTTIHPHIATPYELAAATEGRLKSIVLPLTGGWVSGDPSGWPTKGLECGFAVGDRIYLAEEWCKGDWGDAFDDDIYFTKSTTPEAEHIGWQPASTMPPKAAQYWYEVTGARVKQARDFTHSEIIGAGATKSDIFDGTDGAWEKFWGIAKQNWNAAYPQQPWHGDLWVVVLGVEAVNGS